MVYDVAVVGGGASGMIGAIAAARHGKKVLLLEHKNKLGKKILATGNGKCNYTNAYQSEECYFSGVKDFTKKGLEKFGQKETTAFFLELGIYPKIKNGYYYPASEQSSSVLNVLLMELFRLSVRIVTEFHVDRVQFLSPEKEFLIEGRTKTETQELPYSYHAQNVMLSTGGSASASLGSDGSGYILAEQLGLSVIPPLSGLTGLYSSKNYFRKLAGVRSESRISLFCSGKRMDESYGELQLTSYGVSGIPVFQLCHHASKALWNKEEVWLLVDLFPKFEKEDLCHFLWERSRQVCNQRKNLIEIFTGFVNDKLSAVLIEQAGLTGKMSGAFLEYNQCRCLADQMKEFKIPIVKTNSLENAQVTVGGVAVTQIHPNTMEVKEIPGLYITGELLDVDGLCGGYNLQWAWTSGWLAGNDIGSSTKNTVKS